MRKKKNLEPRLLRSAGKFIDEPACFKGNWRALFLRRKLRLEIGCGKGRFLTQLALKEPDVLFIGLEKVASVVVSAAEKAESMDLENARFIIGDARDLENFFSPGELEAIYLNFSDPWPSPRHWHRRLTHGSFLRVYGSLLAPGGLLELKTDNRPLFDFTLRELKSDGWTVVEASSDLPESEEDVQTEYEARFRARGVPICRVKAFLGEKNQIPR
jgi:tRNA (guanine-N7-)-methyltransferase